MIDKDFLEAADDLVSAYRVVRRLAVRAIQEREALQKKVDKVLELMDRPNEAWYDIIDLKNDLEDILDDEPPVV